MSEIRVEYDNVRIVFAGPARSERTARKRLAQVIYEGFADGYDPIQPTEIMLRRGFKEWEGLQECDYLHFSSLDEKIAEEIAFDKVQYTAMGTKIKIHIISLDVRYYNFNPKTGARKPRKWWARIRNGIQTIEPGDRVR